MTPAERRLVQRLRTPLAVQRWLNALPYNTEKGGETLRTFRGVVREGGGGQRTGEIPGTGHLERVLVNDKLEELRRESLLVPLRMRIRDVRQGPDELLYVLVDHENGGVLRIEPSVTKQVPTNYSARPAR